VYFLALYWAMDKVSGPDSGSVRTRKPISSQLQYGRLIQATLIRLDYLVLHTFGPTCQVRQAYRHVGGSSCGPDPLVEDSREPGRWGPVDG
jgi:hypothetical protein